MTRAVEPTHTLMQILCERGSEIEDEDLRECLKYYADLAHTRVEELKREMARLDGGAE